MKKIICIFLALCTLFLTSCASMVKMEESNIKVLEEAETQESTECIPIYRGQLPGEKYPYYLPDATLDYHYQDSFVDDKVTINNTDFSLDDKTEDYFNTIVENNSFNIGFYMIDIETGASFGYNAANMFTPACTIKAGYALYVLREVAEGNASWDDTIKFERKHQSTGTGYIWKLGVGAVLTVKEIVYHLINESDNVAYYMLVDHFGADGYNELMEELGVTNRITDTRIWTTISPRDLGLIWMEIYRFKDQCEEGAWLWDVATHNKYNFVAYALNDCGQLGYETIAHKSGYGEHEYNDAAVVMAEHPYVIVCMTSIDARSYAFIKTCQWLDKVIKQYWAYYYNE